MTAAQLKADFDVAVEASLASGTGPSAVAAHARSTDAELIVVGSGNGAFLIELLETEHQLRYVRPAPVLVAARASAKPYKRLLLAADLSPYTAHAGRVARRLFPSAALHVLHACKPLYERALNPDEALVGRYHARMLSAAAGRVRAFARDAGLGAAAVFEVRLGDPGLCLRKRVQELDADLLVVHPGRTSLAAALANSLLAELLVEPPCDLLIVG
jgi:nucleotide-binding universal stress UspA family protein